MSKKKYNEIEVKDNVSVKDEVPEEPIEKEKLKSVVSNSPTKVKRGLLSRLVTGIVGPEGLPGIGSYVNEEIVKPAIKNIIVDAVTSGINMVMYGEKGGPSRSRHYNPYHGSGRSSYRPNTNYGNNYRNSGESVQTDRVSHPRPLRMGVHEYKIEDRYDASHVLTALTENADRYGSVSVADYYDLIGMEAKYTDNNYGWTMESIIRASIVPVRGGYVIKFPPVEEI